MGFYGNITNTSNTTFSFDRIYPNRLAMDANANNDGIFIGRYVLVEYDNKATISNIFVDIDHPVKTVDGEKYYYAYTTDNFTDINTRIQYKPNNRGENKNINVYFLGEFGQVQKVEGNQLQQEYYTEFYQCVDSVVSENDSTIFYALFKYVTKSTKSDSEYIKNFAIDESQYKEKKGYDSTVWTKASVKKENGLLVTEYVRIADLNSVVPTFDLETDAPTMKPLVPHFDADSTNVYYKLHAQPQWGLRVAEVESGKISDSKTNWISSTYNPETGQLIPSEDNGEHDAAIYFNKAAFLSQVDINRKTTDGINKKKEDNQEKNYFTINPTGTSGNQYYLHTALDQNGNLQKIYGPAVDIQEMVINLPAIGNMMSDAWDIIYGPKRDKARTDEDGSLQGRLDSFKAIEDNHIPIKRNDDGTIIGTAINGNSHYQMPNGKNILTTTHFPLTTNDPWINVTIDNSSLQGGYDKDNKIEISQEKNNAIHIRHNANSVDSTTTSWDKNDAENYANNSHSYYEIDTNINGNQDEIKLYTPYVDATGHVVGKNIETVTLPYGYKYFKTDGLSPKDTEGKDIVDDLYSTVNYTSTEDIKKTDDIANSSVAHNTQDILTINPHNKWIQTKIEDTENNGDILTIAHEIHSIDERYDSNTNLNNLSVDNENEEGNLTIYDWDYDEAGHINKKREHTYTLPYGFKYIKTNGLAKENNLDITNKDLDEPKTETATANSTQDTFNIDTVNKWIQVEVTDNDNRIKIAHELHKITEDVITETTDDLNNQKNNQIQNTVNIPDWSFDNAGHITHKSDRIYTLPYGYKTFTVSNSNTVGPHTVGNGTLVARNTRDNLTFVTENNWIALEAIADNEIGNKIYIGHKTNGNSFGKTYYAMSSGLTADTTIGNNQIPNFGDNVKILNVVVDNAGHVTGFGTNTIKIPDGDLTDAVSNGADVITQLTFDKPTGHLTSTRTNVGTLKLTGYELPTYITGEGELSANATINDNFGRLEFRLNKEVSDREDAIAKEVSDRNTAITNAIAGIFNKNDDNEINKLAEIIEWINNNPSTATEMQTAIQNNTNAISNEVDLAREKEAEIADALITEIGRATAAEQTNATAIENEKTRAENIEQGLQGQIEVLQTTIENLQKQINELKNPPQQPDNSGEIV